MRHFTQIALDGRNNITTDPVSHEKGTLREGRNPPLELSVTMGALGKSPNFTAAVIVPFG